MSTRTSGRLAFSQTIPSRMADAEALCLKVRGALQACGLMRLCHPVELLARECLANALNHGNACDADKSVLFRFGVGREWVRMEIRDEGPGFAWRKAHRRGLDPCSPTGRGLQLCALFAGRVRFNRRGNQITLWIRKK